MTGSKMLIGSVLIMVLAFIYGGIYHPTSLLMSLTDTSPLFMVIRAFVAALLIVLLVTKPPRSYFVRTLIGTGSVILAGVSLGMLFSYQMQVFDAVVFLEIAIILGLESLEVRTIRVKEKYLPPRRIAVRSV